jgi:phosphoglucomutase
MIRFGTSGWRAVMGKEFTAHNVRLVVQAIANCLKRKHSRRRISLVVNYDTRFLSEKFAFEASKVLARNGIYVFLAERDAPSQAQAYQIIKRQAQGGINFTASFNPPQYNGLKFNTASGAPAMPQETDEIEAEVKRLQPSFSFLPSYPRLEYIEKVDLRPDYLAFIQKKIDFALIRRSKLRVAVDLLFGTSREYLDEILEENRIPLVEIHGYIDPYFGGVTPSCTEQNLAELKRLVLEQKCNLGIATDADGDRFGIVDEKGALVNQNLILALLLDYVVGHKGWRGGLARSVATTHLVDRIARKYDLPLFKTPVGFKYLADLFLRRKIIFGGEESACLAVRDHLPEKDGIFAGLLVAEMLAAKGRTLTQLSEDLYQRYGCRVDGQKSVSLTPDREKRLRRLMKNPPRTLDGRAIVGVETLDGLKLDFEDDDWLLFRFSGTEPLLRCYAEAGSKKEMNRLMKLGLEMLS